MTLRILVLGSGQLGSMLAEASVSMGVPLDRLDLNTNEILAGHSDLAQTLSIEEIKQRYSTISVELEHIPNVNFIDEIRRLEIWENERALISISSRHNQKKLLDKLEIPNTPWKIIQNEKDFSSIANHLGNHVIFKTVLGGYDGKGQWNIKNTNKCEPSFFSKNFSDVAVIAEKNIDFISEVSLIGARGRDGGCVFYPLVKNVHENGILRFTVAPFPCDSSMQKTAEQYLSTIMEELSYVGVMAMECFITQCGKLIINELAPRVHNSGHWTQLGSDLSQFKLHVMALLGWSLPKKIDTKPSVMLNLIGCKNPFYALHQYDNIQCYWYGKSQRENRKLGHINISFNNLNDNYEIFNKLQKILDDDHIEFLSEALEQSSKKS